MRSSIIERHWQPKPLVSDEALRRFSAAAQAAADEAHLPVDAESRGPSDEL